MMRNKLWIILVTTYLLTYFKFKNKMNYKFLIVKINIVRYPSIINKCN